jgi:hypothetical protein
MGVQIAVGCGAGNMTTPVIQNQSGTIFVSGGDTPFEGVTAS